MGLNADTLLDRINLKAQLTRWRVFAIVCVVVTALLALERFSGNKTPLKGDFVARLTIDGVITDDPLRDELIQDIRNNSHIKAVIVKIDSPGGAAVGGQELYMHLRELSKSKPTVTVMRNMATSAGYMIALGTDQIFAREGTITGSIGVILQMAEFTELAKKLGINPITIKSGANKGSPSPFEKITPEQGDIVQSVIMDFYNVFVDMVAERRRLPRETVLKLADGRIYSGGQAVQNKLIDAIGGEQEAFDWLVKNRKISSHLKIDDVKPENEDAPLIEKLSEATGSRLFGVFKGNRLDGLVGIWQANTL